MAGLGRLWSVCAWGLRFPVRRRASGWSLALGCQWQASRVRRPISVLGQSPRGVSARIRGQAPGAARCGGVWLSQSSVPAGGIAHPTRRERILLGVADTVIPRRAWASVSWSGCLGCLDHVAPGDGGTRRANTGGGWMSGGWPGVAPGCLGDRMRTAHAHGRGRASSGLGGSRSTTELAFRDGAGIHKGDSWMGGIRPRNRAWLMTQGQTHGSRPTQHGPDSLAPHSVWTTRLTKG